MASILKDKQSGKWYCRVTYYDDAGKRRLKTKKGFDTKKEAAVYASKLEVSIANNDLETEMTLADYFDKWCHTYKIGKVSISSEENYLLNMRLVKEYFKELQLKDLTRLKYQEFINWRGQNRSKNTVEKTHHKLKRCIQTAFADGLIKTDPTFNIVLTFDKNEPTKVKAWNENEFNQLVATFESEPTPKNTMLYIAALTGLRVGEIYGLAWDDITDDALSVKRGYNYIQNNDFTAGKTASSVRVIPIPARLKTQIAQYKLRYRKQSPDYLFLDKKERPIISHHTLLKHLKKICRQLEIPELGIHNLRHTHCSLLIAKGIDINYISKRLGHNSTNETLSTYAHIIDEYAQKQNTEVLAILDNCTLNVHQQG